MFACRDVDLSRLGKNEISNNVDLSRLGKTRFPITPIYRVSENKLYGRLSALLGNLGGGGRLLWTFFQLAALQTDFYAI